MQSLRHVHRELKSNYTILSYNHQFIKDNETKTLENQSQLFETYDKVKVKRLQTIRVHFKTK